MPDEEVDLKAEAEAIAKLSGEAMTALGCYIEEHPDKLSPEAAFLGIEFIKRGAQGTIQRMKLVPINETFKRFGIDAEVVIE